MKLYMAIDKALAVIRQQNGEWIADLQLVGSSPQCVAVDPLQSEQVYCGTFDQGLWHMGLSWYRNKLLFAQNELSVHLITGEYLPIAYHVARRLLKAERLPRGGCCQHVEICLTARLQTIV